MTLTRVFNSVGLPVESIGMLFGIGHILDMFRTAVNITDDAICTLIVSFKTNSLMLTYATAKRKRMLGELILKT